jgi:hypothetical protein
MTRNIARTTLVILFVAATCAAIAVPATAQLLPGTSRHFERIRKEIVRV